MKLTLIYARGSFVIVVFDVDPEGVQYYIIICNDDKDMCGRVEVLSSSFICP